MAGNQEFDTPQDALKHHGVKGMKWGVINEDKGSSGSSRRSSDKPKEIDSNELSKAVDQVFGKMSPAEIKAEGQAKLNAQAKNGDFPSKRDQKAEKLRARAAEIDKVAAQNRAAADKIGDPGFNLGKRYVKKVYNNQADINEQARDSLLKKADQVQAGKLTDSQKRMLIVGGLAAVAVAGSYGSYKYAEHKVGLTADDKKSLLDANKRESERQWEQLFGEKHSFEPAGSSFSVSSGSFYAGFTNKKALSRPEFTIPAGTKFQRLSDHMEDSSEYGKVKGAYATFLSNDKKIYGASHEFGSKKFTVEFEADGETRVPNVTTVLAHLKQVRAAEDPFFKNASTESLLLQYKQMAGGSWSNGTSMKLFESLRSHGYSAIVDDMDAGYLGDLPVVFFGSAKPATATERTAVHKFQDKAATMKLTRRHA